MSWKTTLRSSDKNDLSELVFGKCPRIPNFSLGWLEASCFVTKIRATVSPHLSAAISFSIYLSVPGEQEKQPLFPSLKWGNRRAANETMIEPIKKARLCIYYKKPNKGPGLMPWGWGHTSSRARLIMNANKHNESNRSERGAATSFGKPLGNSTWHVSGVLLITQRATGTHSLLRQWSIPFEQTERERVNETERTRD